jgi:heme ABC exporter ATP-binding subunit CcmA
VVTAAVVNGVTHVSQVDVTGLTRVFGRRYAIRNVTFSLGRGTITAIIGANGAGKTTVLSLLARRMRPTSGEISFDGKVLTHESERRRACGYHSHATMLYGALTARENMDLVAGLHQIEDAPVADVLSRIGLAKHADRFVRTFSRGMQQRLALGRLFLTEPDIWLLDEPASGLDTAGQSWLVGELKAQASAGKIIALTSHNREFASELATHVLALNRGRQAQWAPVSDQAAFLQIYNEVVS